MEISAVVFVGSFVAAICAFVAERIIKRRKRREAATRIANVARFGGNDDGRPS